MHALADERLLRQVLRNLLESQKCNGGDDILLESAQQDDSLQIPFNERGPNAELGLSLMQLLNRQHGGPVQRDAREGGGLPFLI